MTPSADQSSWVELRAAELELICDALELVAAAAGDNARKWSRTTIRELRLRLSGPAVRAGARIGGPPRHLPERVTIAEAAEALGYSIGHVRRMVAEGQIPGAKKFGNTWTVPLEELT